MEPQPRPRIRRTSNRDRDQDHDSPSPKRGSSPSSTKRPIRHQDSDDNPSLRRQIDRLERDLGRRDRELEEERMENEKYIETIKKLERDKVELKREIEGLRDEADDYRRTLEDLRAKRDEGVSEDEDQTDDMNLKRRDKLSLQQKNREIQQLLEDNERLEDEKHSLEDKLSELKDSLSEATRQMESMTQEHFSFNDKAKQFEDKIKTLEEEKAVLGIREKELLAYKERHDQYLENLCNAVDIRVDVWKKIISDKDEEIDRLNAKIEALVSQIPNQQLDSDKLTIQSLNKKLSDRDYQISLLNEKLAQATEHLLTNSKVIEQLQNQLNLSQDPSKSEHLITQLTSQVTKLESKLSKRSHQLLQVEKEAEEKSMLLTSLMSRMSQYEAGMYGLPEAVSEIKDLKTQLKIRDKQIESLTQESNIIQMQVNDLQEENEMLREKLGLDNSKDVNRETKKYVKTRKNELSALRLKVIEMEDEIVNLKTKNYSMKKQLQQYDLQLSSRSILTEREHYEREGPEDPSQIGFSESSWKDRYEVILNENSSLRQGLSEVLECIHKMSEEGTSDVLIQAPVLEQLLREMSARGIINYPFPLTSFHLKVCNLEGKCEQLREELHLVRTEERNAREELYEARNLIKLLQEGKGQINMIPQVPKRTRHASETDLLTTISVPQLIESSTSIVSVEKEDKEIQVTLQVISSSSLFTESVISQQESEEKTQLVKSLHLMTLRVSELEEELRIKELELTELRVVKMSHERSLSREDGFNNNVEMQEALAVARETISSLQQRLQSKENNISQYRRLLADVRAEMSTATERHVQEMRALQLTIHQQQQAFTRMKSTLSHPVKDTLSTDSTIRDQLTRIHELEDEVAQLQHAMSNTATQLTAARSEAHRWRSLVDAKTKEIENARDQSQSSLKHELAIVRQELNETQRKLEETLRNENMGDLIHILKSEIEEKEQQIEAYQRSIQSLRSIGNVEDKLKEKEIEINLLKEDNQNLHKTVASQQLQISKTKAINLQKGTTKELEDLKLKYKSLLEEKEGLDKSLSDLNKKRDEEEQKKLKSTETIAKWEESKKWKQKIEKFELEKKNYETEIEKLSLTNKNLRITVSRLEKDRNLLESKLGKALVSHTSSSSSRSSGTLERYATDLNSASQQAYLLGQGEIAKLKMEIQDWQELSEKVEFEGKEEAEKLKVEIKLLKDRIVSQERQLTAYQIAQKGDAKVIKEIEHSAAKESQLLKEIRRLEEDNLHLNLQLEQVRLDVPRLRDRIQHLQKLVEVLKSEKPQVPIDSEVEKKSQKSLGELEKTIHALKNVVGKLQNENKKLKETGGLFTMSPSRERLKTSMGSVLEENKQLIDRIQYLEHEFQKSTKKASESSCRVENLEQVLKDTEKRAQSAEMKLRTLLDIQKDPKDKGQGGHSPSTSSTALGYDSLVQKMRTMQLELDNKGRLLAAAKQSLLAAEKATAPKPVTSPRRQGQDKDKADLSSSGPSSGRT